MYTSLEYKESILCIECLFSRFLLFVAYIKVPSDVVDWADCVQILSSCKVSVICDASDKVLYDAFGRTDSRDLMWYGPSGTPAWTFLWFLEPPEDLTLPANFLLKPSSHVNNGLMQEITMYFRLFLYYSILFSFLYITTLQFQLCFFSY